MRPIHVRARLHSHAAMLVASALLAACDRTPTAPSTPLTAGQPSYAISDAAHGGAAGFYFLAPLVPAPTYSGTFDATQLPVVRVCELAGTAASRSERTGGRSATRTWSCSRTAARSNWSRATSLPVAELNTLTSNINSSFIGGFVSPWAQDHIVRGSCS